MTTRLVQRIASGFLLTIFSLSAVAAPILIWNNGISNNINGWNFGNLIADDFILSADQTLGAIDIYLFNQSVSNTHDLYVRVDGIDIEIISSSHIPSGSLSTVPIYLTSLDVRDTAILKGLHSLEVGSISANSNLAWMWTDTAQLQPSTVGGVVIAGYPPTDVAFQLYAATNSVPEPATLALVGTALAGVAATRRRRPAPGMT